MKKIAFVSTQDFVPWGGSEELWFNAALECRKLGFEVFVNIMGWPEKVKQVGELEKSGCSVHRRRQYPTVFQKVSYNLKPGLREIDKISSYYNWLKTVRPSLLVLSVELAPRGKEWMQACVELNIPFVIVNQLADECLWHSQEELQNTSELYDKALKVFLLSKENYVAISKQLCNDIKNKEWFSNPFNVDVNKKFSYPDTNSGYKIASVARFGIEHKRQDILLDILNERKWKEREIHLTLYGQGVHRRSLENLIKFYGLSNVKIAGHVEKIDSVWEQNHALVMPSRYEGVSLAMLEALISYRTCIVSKVGGVSELIQDNLTGFVAKAATTELFEEAMERAWERKLEWPEIGKLAGEATRANLPQSPMEDFVSKILPLIS